MATDPIEQGGGQKAESASGATAATAVVADQVADRERWADCAFDDVAASWRRSAENHRIDPASMVAPHVLTTAELRESREPIEPMVRAVQSELDRLYGVVRRAGYVVLFCDTNGVAIDYRGDEARSAQFRYWGVWVGGAWSEAMEGTNGIGTCIAEQRPITVHQTQHFRARHGSLSCSGAPVFGADARLTAVLDVSSIDSDLSAQSHGLTLPVVAAAARTLEERLFREAYAGSWIVALAPMGDQAAPLLAVDRDHRVVGADVRARAEFGLRQESLVRGLSLWDLFTANPSLFRRHGAGADSVVGLRDKHGGLRCALVSSPVRSVRSHISSDAAEFLMRPRVTLLTELERHFAVQPPRGGLSAGALRRVCEFVESHLEDDISLEALAAEARLSVYHFARGFKLSTGVSPHRYVLEQRVKRARQLLVQTDLPLATIASAVGFFDQGHFSRQFRSLVGTTPSSFRRANHR
jgi:transcriptional regulator of acetoin/glycerol metabolism/AraC-like DNA-binding protein